ncbi:MAG: sulfatase-like hydrolase/transferase, partial [Planctomycetota bacterium]
HVPRMPHERFHGKSEMGFRGDSIVQLDWCVGELMQSLKDNGMEDNTLVVFCSDNGPVMDDGYKDGALEKRGDHRAAGQYTGGKYSVYEGGTRTPFITRWPGVIRPGTSDAIVCTIDLPRSISTLVKARVPDGAFSDSENVMSALMRGNPDGGRTRLVQQDNGKSGSYGYRNGKWKLHRYDKKKAYNKKVESPLANSPAPQFALFDLEADPAEKNNLAGSHPQVLQRMKSELQSLIQ